MFELVNKIRLTHYATTIVLALNRKRPQIVTAITKVAANINFTNFSCTTCVNVHSMTTARQERRNMSPNNRVPLVPAWCFQCTITSTHVLQVIQKPWCSAMGTGNKPTEEMQGCTFALWPRTTTTVTSNFMVTQCINRIPVKLHGYTVHQQDSC